MDKQKIIELMDNGEWHELLQLAKSDDTAIRIIIKILGDYHLTLQHFKKILEELWKTFLII